MEIKGTPEFHFDDTLKILIGPSKEQIIFLNQMAATALDHFHKGSNAKFELSIDGKQSKTILNWNSSFSKHAMKEKKKIAEDGGVAVAFFIMSVLLEYKWVMQTEIGEGVDYSFKKEEPTDENFLQGSHNIEVSGILSETS